LEDRQIKKCCQNVEWRLADYSSSRERESGTHPSDSYSANLQSSLFNILTIHQSTNPSMQIIQETQAMCHRANAEIVCYGLAEVCKRRARPEPDAGFHRRPGHEQRHVLP
jgi:hypothetical protein